jgi:WD repeat-containing protein 35
MFDITNTSFSTAQSPETFQMSTEAIADPICCISISDKYMMVGRKSGALTRFNLPHLTPENTYTLRDREPHRMDFNCTSTKLGFIDGNGVFTILDLEARVTEGAGGGGGGGGGGGEEKGTAGEREAGAAGSSKMILGPYYGRRLNVERKDVWDMKWSEDDPDMIVIMEKTKMVVFHGETAEDPVVSSGYLARFQDLEIRVVAMDDLMMHPDKTSRHSIPLPF